MRMTTAQENATTWKVAVVGHGGGGKTQFERRTVGEPFQARYLATIGVDFDTTIYPVSQAAIVLNLQVWDVAGQPRYRPMSASFFRGFLPLVFILYDVTAATSSTTAIIDPGITQDALKTLQETSHIVVVGNKADLLDDGGASLMTDEALQQGQLPLDAVTGSTTAVQTADAFCIEQKLPHYVVSAKTGAGMEMVMRKAVEASLRKHGYPCSSRQGGVRLPFK